MYADRGTEGRRGRRRGVLESEDLQPATPDDGNGQRRRESLISLSISAVFSSIDVSILLTELFLHGVYD